MFLFCTSLGAVGVPLDPPRLLGICRTVTRWFILRDQQHPAKDGARVIEGDVDPDLLKLAVIRRRGSSHGMGEPLLVNLLPQAAATEGVSCALVEGPRYIELIAMGVRLRL
jgi:hypothetical protein